MMSHQKVETQDKVNYPHFKVITLTVNISHIIEVLIKITIMEKY